MNEQLVNIYAAKFISRPDVKAIQRPDGSYNPVRSPFTKADLLDHLMGKQTYGHYTVNQNDETKFFAFDIDFEQKADIPDDFFNPERTPSLVAANPRELWRDRSSIHRPYLKYILRYTANRLASTAFDDLELPVAIAYSGYKGLHVYCFLPKGTSAHDAREGAKLVIDNCTGISPSRGSNFFKLDDPELQAVSIEIFPKQDTMAGKDLGNLMRLPLGRNLKSKDPTFFVDCHAAMNELLPVSDPITALEKGNPWA